MREDYVVCTDDNPIGAIPLRTAKHTEAIRTWSPTDEVTHAAEVQNSAMRQNRNSRCSSDRQKDITYRGSSPFLRLEKEKSQERLPAEVIVVAGNEPSSRIVS
jgi:hypothetical protein